MALATLLAFTPALEGSGAQGSGAERLEWSVWTPITVSFVFMSASGQSVRQAMLRVGGTVAGSVYALLLVIAAKGDVLAIAVGLTLWASLLAPFRASQRNSYAGAVAAFTAAIVAVADREEGGSISDVAVSRMLQNCVGAAIFLGVTHIVWPHHGSVGSLKAVSETMGEAGEALRLALAKLATDMPDQVESDSLSESGWPRPDAASTEVTATVAMLTTQVEAFAQDLPPRLADARIEMGLSASQHAADSGLDASSRAFRFASAHDPLSLAMNTAVFAARQAAEAALALAATVELVAAHLMPLDNMPDWVRLEKDRKLL